MSMPETKKPRKPRKPSPKLQEVIRLLETGECRTQRAAAARANLTERYVSEALRHPEIGVWLTQKRLANIQTAALRASAKVGALVDAVSEHVAAETSLKVLALAGHTPVERSHVRLDANIAVGYIIALDRPADRGEPDIVASASPARLETSKAETTAEQEAASRRRIIARSREPHE
jgi:hypothetical protein